MPVYTIRLNSRQLKLIHETLKDSYEMAHNHIDEDEPQDVADLEFLGEMVGLTREDMQDKDDTINDWTA